nr:TrmH family RNA methyltransferase [Mycoplasmopsis bovis]
MEHEVHNSYSDFYNKYKDKNIYYITRYGLKTYSDVDFKKEYENNEEIWLMFGKESTGIDKQVLKDNIDNCLRIPMISKMRSINLANCVAIVGFEVMRQIDFKDLSLYESQKGKNFIKEWTKE